MTTYINEIVTALLKSNQNLSDFVFVLPSKRAGTFIKKEILSHSTQTQFAPEILSIEELIEKIADLKIASSIELLFEFYEVYLNEIAVLEKESFESFSSWASVLIDDFNEIDRNLIDQNRFFNYLNEIKEVEHWYLNDQKTPLIKNYLSFWNSLPTLYQGFTEQSKQKGFAHQGLVYREAAGNIEHYKESKKEKLHIFIGFNALNKAEEVIIQEMLESGNTKVYWDAEAYFMDKPYHSASLFLREIKNTWKFYKENTFLTVSNYFEQPKTINITGCSKNLGQVKCASEILNALPENELVKTALVLADENLLIPMLNSLPLNISAVNITMGLPLKSIPATSFFDSILKLHRDEQKSFYYKNVLEILNHPLSGSVIPKSASKINETLRERNLTHINYPLIASLVPENEMKIIHSIFSPENVSVESLISNAKKILLALKEKQINDDILIQALYKLYEVWNKLETLNNKFSHIKTTKTLYQLFKEISSLTSIDFKGEPYQGLQIMGLLETRSLDFERVILLSANEGTLPAGKSNKSFITFDLKKEFNLPTHKEKDAVYTYHFYSLLHRAKKIDLLYNNHSSGLNAGEKSRFLMQLAYESPASHEIKEYVYTPKIDIPEKALKQIEKTPLVIEKLKNLVASGLSPSAITTYIRNPIDFYDRYILGIRDIEEIEETVAANTLGTIVHNTLEALYTPYINEILSIEIIKLLRQKVDEQVAAEFQNTFKEGNIESGKNKIIFEISKRYVRNFLKMELLEIQQGNEIIISSLENKLETQLEIPELDFPVNLRGTVDRIDTYNGTTRIIDYKTGLVKQTDLNLSEWELLFSDYDKHSKKIQVLAYALMSENDLNFGNTQAGIISFRNLGQGFLPFNYSEKSSSIKGIEIFEETLSLYKTELNKIIVEICNPEIPFTEKEIKQYAF
jgi:ATP-dependent helicase/nuclease subunit B